MGYRRETVNESLEKERFDDIHATYLLLGERKHEVLLVYVMFEWVSCY